MNIVAIRLLSFVLGVIGLITLPLPLPTGIPCLVASFALLASTSPPMLSTVRDLRVRNPQLNVTLVNAERLSPGPIRRALRLSRP